MNRRGFLQLIGAAAAGFVLDPELALWKPGAKTIFLPPVMVAPLNFDDYIRLAAKALADEWDARALTFCTTQVQSLSLPVDIDDLSAAGARRNGRELAQVAIRRGLHRIDAPMVPRYIEEGHVMTVGNVSLRGVRAFDAVESRMMARLDICSKADA